AGLAERADRGGQLQGNLALARSGRAAVRLAAGERPFAARRRVIIGAGQARLALAALVAVGANRSHVGQALAAHLFLVAAAFLALASQPRTLGFGAGQAAQLLL